jgi:hypothetical protein
MCGVRVIGLINLDIIISKRYLCFKRNIENVVNISSSFLTSEVKNRMHMAKERTLCQKDIQNTAIKINKLIK